MSFIVEDLERIREEAVERNVEMSAWTASISWELAQNIKFCSDTRTTINTVLLSFSVILLFIFIIVTLAKKHRYYSHWLWIILLSLLWMLFVPFNKGDFCMCKCEGGMSECPSNFLRLCMDRLGFVTAGFCAIQYQLLVSYRTRYHQLAEIAFMTLCHVYGVAKFGRGMAILFSTGAVLYGIIIGTVHHPFNILCWALLGISIDDYLDNIIADVLILLFTPKSH